MPRTLRLAGALGHPTADKRVEILRRVGQVGSISQAARDAGVSYKAAWQALDTLSNLAGVPLVERAVGGSGGGGARLTRAGERLLAGADELHRAREAALERWRGAPAVPPGLAALALRTSMRNQLPAIVRSVRARAGAMRIALELPGAHALAARITRESAQLLELAPGREVLALCKATAVDIAPPGAPTGGRNALAGTVTRTSRAAAGGEVALALPGGLQLVGFVGPGAGLRVKDAAVALVDDSAVVVALAQ